MKLHSGFFFESIGKDVPSFSPIRRRCDPDIAAAARGADVFLTRVPYHEDASPGWKIKDCRGGCLLNYSTEQITVYNPLTRALDLFPTPPDDGKFCYMNYFLLYSDQSPHWLICGTQVNGKLYWPHADQAYIVVLHTATLHFSSIDLLEHLKGQGCLFELGATKDGKLSIVSVFGFTLHTWFRRTDASGAEEWMLHDVIPLEGEILQATEMAEDELWEHRPKVLAVLDGILYMSIDGEHTSPSWFLSFCLETRKLEKLFQRTFDNCVYPYIMGWPPFLIGNDNDMALGSGV